MIKLYCNYCDDELSGMSGAELHYVKIASSLDSSQPQAQNFSEHLCDKCLEKAQKALKKTPKASQTPSEKPKTDS